MADILQTLDETAAPDTSPAEAAPKSAPLPQVVLDQDALYGLRDIFGTNQSQFREGFARSVLTNLRTDLEGLVPATLGEDTRPDFSYEAFREGRHSLGEIPGYSDFAGLPLSDDNIRNLFTNVSAGDELSLFEAAARGILPSAASLGAAYTGAKTAAKVAPLVTLNPAGRAAATIAGGAVGAVLGDYGMNRIIESNAIFGKEAPIIPGTATLYEGIKAAGAALPWAAFPWMVSKDVSFGTANWLANWEASLGKGRLGPTIFSSQRPVGPSKKPTMVIRDEFGGLKKVKPPMSIRLTDTLETALGKTAVGARDYKVRTAMSELGAVGGTGLGAAAIESVDPGAGGLGRFGAEFAGGVTGSILASGGFYGPTALLFRAAKRARDAYRETGTEAVGAWDRTKAMGRAAFTGFQAGKQQQAGTRIREILETYGYDDAQIEDLIKRLQDPTVVSDVGGVPLSSASKTGDPVLQAIEFSLANSLQGVSEKQRQANKQAAVALTAAINSLRDSGDPNDVRLAAQMFYDAFESKLSTRLMERVKRFTEALQKVRPDADAAEASEGLFKAINTSLKVARDEEARIWGRVGNVPVTAYLDENGNQIADPQFLRTFRDRIESEAFDALTEENKQELSVLVKAADEALIQLGLKPPPTPPEQEALDAARNSFNDALRKAAGTKQHDRLKLIQSGGTIASREIERAADGSLTASDKNVEILNRIINDLADTKGAEAARTRALVEQQRNVLIAEQDAAAAAAAAPPVSPTPLRASQLIAFRQRALAYARKYGAVEGYAGFSKIASDAAAAAQRDLDNFVEIAAEQGLDAKAIDRWRVATAYSRALNDTFTRGFVDQATSRLRNNAYRIEPEVLIGKLRSTNDASSQRFRQILAIDDFLKKEAGFTPTPEDDFQTVSGAVENVLRRIFSDDRVKVVNGEEVIDPQRMQDWINKNEEFLTLYPQLRDDLSNLDTANQLLRTTRDVTAPRLQAHKDQSNYAKLLGGDIEAPAVLVSRAIESNAPVASLLRLTSPLKSKTLSPEQLDSARAGLKSAVLEATVGIKAGFLDTAGSPTSAFKLLFEPMERASVYRPSLKRPRDFEAGVAGEGRKISLMEVMVDQGVFSPEESSRLRRLMTQLVRLETLDAAKNVSRDQLVDAAGPMMDFYMRIAGSALGTAAQRMSPLGPGGPGALVAASAGSKLVRQMFDQMPQMSKLQFMQEMMENPELLATMLSKPKTEAQAWSVGSALKTMLVKLGFVGAARRGAAAYAGPESQEMPEEEAAPAAAPAAPAAPPQKLEKQSSLQVPRFELPSQAAAMPAPRPTGQTNPQQRAGLAKMFPNDPILGAAGGIGSLMG